jgi:MFS family permease
VIVVSNSSPIMNLAVVGQVQALERLYGKIYIPEAVWQELAAIGTGQPWAAVMLTLSWLETRSVSHQSLARAHTPTLAPSTLSLIRNMFRDRRQRTFAIGVWATSFSVGAAIGPLLGGLLLHI